MKRKNRRWTPPKKFTPGIKSFYSLKYKKKFRDYNEFEKYHFWRNKLRILSSRREYDGNWYEPRGAIGVRQIKRPYTKWFKPKRGRF